MTAQNNKTNNECEWFTAIMTSLHSKRNNQEGALYGETIKLIEGLEQEIEDLKSRLEIAGNAIGEFAHAQESGPRWYTRGRDGMYDQVRTWLIKGLKATEGFH